MNQRLRVSYVQLQWISLNTGVKMDWEYMLPFSPLSAARLPCLLQRPLVVVSIVLQIQIQIQIQRDSLVLYALSYFNTLACPPPPLPPSSPRPRGTALVACSAAPYRPTSPTCSSAAAAAPPVAPLLPRRWQLERPRLPHNLHAAVNHHVTDLFVPPVLTR
jgi:hypothetical protein